MAWRRIAAEGSLVNEALCWSGTRTLPQVPGSEASPGLARDIRLANDRQLLLVTSALAMDIGGGRLVSA